ncbi:hypothetical protein IMG5_039540 [Ichthyophthirius multifiliis]|uniref:deoxyribose-phosphate aldolase n=1 Tax=Ichthyophthirius multifiliis TaxID=5932 RepID=G0QLZ4_ICHMU|nr:hypothetical protein IMG5_039540 [Ichthyophthirius multifiliis]EGR33759.1 hypothetical protein IMG5_039540 [Ichthyophthirius multifiliis]|eukprot:XP_004038983.1 hypothetical protein IMG5_039540 [Ichthyophthirius multifiliis]
MKKKQFPTEEELKSQIEQEIKKVSDIQSPSLGVLKTIYSLMDLTSLNSTDGPLQIQQWIEKNIIKVLEKHNDLKPAAICVYPNFGNQVSKKVKKLKIKTAVVSTNFPTGQTFSEVKELETKTAIQQGAQEIDMVVNRGFWNEGLCDKVLKEIRDQKKICGKQVNLKVILETCEIQSLESIYKLGYQALENGADFIKTSTGKGKHGATLEHFAVMCLALRDFNQQRKQSRGIKAAGGIQDSKTAGQFYQLAINLLDKVNGDNLRFGTSSLAEKLIKDIELLEEKNRIWKNRKDKQNDQEQKQKKQQIQEY